MSQPPQEDEFLPPQDWSPESDAKEDETEEVPVGVESVTFKYGGAEISADVSGLGELPDPGEQTPPVSWQEVRTKAGRSLMNLTLLLCTIPEATLKLVHGTLEGVRAIVKLPHAISNKLLGARQAAVELEESRQVDSRAGLITHQNVETRTQAIERLNDVLTTLQAKGLHADVRQTPEGVWVVEVVRPELAERVSVVPQDTLKKLDYSPEIASIDGAALKSLRTGLKMTQNVLGEQTAIDPRLISKLERGVETSLNVDLCRALEGVLGGTIATTPKSEES